MIQLVSNGGHTAYNYKEYMVETLADINKLSLEDPIGSTAYVIDENKVYIKKKHEWVPIGGGDTPGPGPEPTPEEPEWEPIV